MGNAIRVFRHPKKTMNFVYKHDTSHVLLQTLYIIQYTSMERLLNKDYEKTYYLLIRSEI